MLTETARNDMLSALGAAYLSLHSAYSATGANELTGGSPAYARLPVSFAPPANGTMITVEFVTFDVPAGQLAWIGLWTALTGPTFLGMVPNGGSTTFNPMKPFVTDDISSEELVSVAHGLLSGDAIVLWAAGESLPSGVAEGIIYYVATPTFDTFKISTISGGTVLDVTGVGQGYWQRIVPLTFAGQGTFRVNALTVSVLGIG